MEVKPQHYRLNYSQDIIYLQTKYTLFKRVVNIVFSITCEEGFDTAVMEEALKLLYQRNDCLRLHFVKEGKEVRQWFAAEAKTGKIRQMNFDTPSKMDAFIKKFRKRPIDIYKGETLEVVFANNPDGKQVLICKVSHFVADTYGIGILVNDLFGVYKALKEGTELPPAPGSFEEVVRKDNEYRDNEELTAKDREFFQDYYTKRHPDEPMYCGVHGNNSDRWLKYKRKGQHWLPYLFVKCDTSGYQFVIPKALGEKVEKWCTENSIPMGSFFYYACALTTSLLNDREPYQLALELLNCRGTVADRKAAGTKVQSLGIYNVVDYGKSFLQNIQELYAEQTELYRHTRLTYLEMEAMQHKQWNFSMLGSLVNYCFSFIPFSTPEGISLQVHSNGKGALVCYMAMMMDMRTHEIFINYDVQDKMVSALQLVDFQNKYIHVIETVLDNSTDNLETVFA